MRNSSPAPQILPAHNKMWRTLQRAASALMSTPGRFWFRLPAAPASQAAMGQAIRLSSTESHEAACGGFWSITGRPTRNLALILLLSGVALLAADGAKRPSAPGGPERIEVPPPPFSDGIFPCTNCHAGMPVDRTRRELAAMHTDIVLKHDESHRWCLDCHDATNRDVLHLASGEPVPFEESYRLCGQCHGEKYRDWRAGVHGRRTGNWNGPKQYLLCANCHNPHQPHFRALAPKPAPKRPSRSMK